MFNKDILKINCAEESERISSFIREQMKAMKKEGIVIGLSGGIDSALSAELSVQAVGPDKVLGLIMPEKESNPVSEQFALKHAQKLGIKTETIDLTPVLESFGSYKKRDSVIKELFPEYSTGYKFKLTLPPDLLKKDMFNFMKLTVISPEKEERSQRLTKNQLNTIVAATDTKQRSRMVTLYYFAEKMNYMVCGTTNRTELLQGFFVKYGDGGVDIEPLAHIYKTQVFALSRYSGVIEEIIERKPSPDTFTVETSDQDFFFRIPYSILDLLLYAWENKISMPEICEIMDLTEDQVNRAFRDFENKFAKTKYHRIMPPTLVGITKDKLQVMSDKLQNNDLRLEM